MIKKLNVRSKLSCRCSQDGNALYAKDSPAPAEKRDMQKEKVAAQGHHRRPENAA